MIVPSLSSPVGTTVEADELDTGAANSEFDAAPEPHRLSDAYDLLGHALTFSRLATSRVMPFESVPSRASTAFGSGRSTFGSGAAVATVGVCTGANANALRGAESVSATMSATPLVPAISPKPRKASMTLSRRQRLRGIQRSRISAKRPHDKLTIGHPCLFYAASLLTLQCESRGMRRYPPRSQHISRTIALKVRCYHLVQPRTHDVRDALCVSPPPVISAVRMRKYLCRTEEPRLA
jgi:hypothetical protein